MHCTSNNYEHEGARLSVLQFSKEVNIHPFVVSDLLFVRDGSVLGKNDIISDEQKKWIISQLNDPMAVKRFPEEYAKLNSDLPWDRPYSHHFSLHGILITRKVEHPPEELK